MIYASKTKDCMLVSDGFDKGLRVGSGHLEQEDIPPSSTIKT